ncbi:MAG: hypothetical protein HZA64_09470 [Rhodocyclales bacterium]|nr:hypothetical protein [Rhodocyclales bacterium]MBI5785674.1 hypothetical protein [Rhodocyclales bacterium]
MDLRQGCLNALLLAGLAGLFGGVPVAAQDADLELQGKRLYRDGILPSGEPVVATVAGGVQTRGRQAACATCHRKSGLGAAEGQNVIRPLTVPGFFAGQENTRRYARPRFVRVRQLQYTDEAFDRALREGASIDGRTLNPLMPRYQLDTQAIAALRAYLTSVALRPAPGVTDTDIHFATIIAPDAEPRVREATLRVLTAMVDTHNAGTRSESHRRQAGIESMHVDWRRWTLHVWELTGGPETWQAQLDRYLGAQPVFSVLSGAGGDWRPVHDFCERQELPCLFPNVDLPGRSEPGSYTLYLSRGLLLEADVMVRHLAEQGVSGSVVQIRHDAFRAGAAADAFREAWRARGKGEVVEKVLRPGDRMNTVLDGVRATKPAAVILWLEGADLAQLGANDLPANALLLASGTLLGEAPPALAPRMEDRLLVVWPFALPTVGEPPLDRVRQWITARGIGEGNQRAQANTYFAASMAGDAITQLANNYSQEYLIERIEHGANRSLATGAFPLAELGPGQRFASKGAYLGRLRGGALTQAGPWTVP